MDVTLVAPPNDSMWWVLRPEFIGFIDKIVIDKDQWDREENSKDRSGYHNLVWERLSVLSDEGLIEVKPLGIDSNRIEKDAEVLLGKVVEENAPGLVEDLINAYKYWISFNELKTELLPKQQGYRKEILNLIPLWQSDLLLLQSAGVEALAKRPKILSYVAKNIFIKVIELEKLNGKYKKCAFSSLREYEPFIKYLMLNEPIILAPESSKLTISSQMITAGMSSSIELAAEPEFDFLKLTLSQSSFKKRILSVLDNYKSARTKLRQMIQRTDDLLFGIAEQSVNAKVMNDLLVINSELSDLRRQASKRSRYLSLTFSGLSMLPVPFISQLLNLLGMGSNKISEIIESGSLANRGLSPNGLSAYYSFLESNINFSKLEGFPEVKTENEKLDSNFFEDPFWRA